MAVLKVTDCAFSAGGCVYGFVVSFREGIRVCATDDGLCGRHVEGVYEALSVGFSRALRSWSRATSKL